MKPNILTDLEWRAFGDFEDALEEEPALDNPWLLVRQIAEWTDSLNQYVREYGGDPFDPETIQGLCTKLIGMDVTEIKTLFTLLRDEKWRAFEAQMEKETREREEED
jgi:hypothetical protein